MIPDETPPPAPTTPPPPRRVRRRRRLDSVDACRRELGWLYAQGVNRSRDVGDVSRLANIVSLIVRVLESSDLERRLAALEASQSTGEPEPWRE